LKSSISTLATYSAKYPFPFHSHRGRSNGRRGVKQYCTVKDIFAGHGLALLPQVLGASSSRRSAYARAAASSGTQPDHYLKYAPKSWEALIASSAPAGSGPSVSRMSAMNRPLFHGLRWCPLADLGASSLVLGRWRNGFAWLVSPRTNQGLRASATRPSMSSPGCQQAQPLWRNARVPLPEVGGRSRTRWTAVNTTMGAGELVRTVGHSPSHGSAIRA
jgi:hypothetical protein